MCDKNEFCHNDNYKGVCLQDDQLGSDEDLKQNDNILNDDNDDLKDDRLDRLPDSYPISEIKSFLQTNDDELANCIDDLNKKYWVYKSDIILSTYLDLLKEACEDAISNSNKPKLQLIDSDNDGKLDLKNYQESKSRLLASPKLDDTFVIEASDEEEPRDYLKLDSTKPDLALGEENLNDKLKEINQNLDEAELFAKENIDKKLDQKKPGLFIKQQKFDDLDNLDSLDNLESKFNEKRFDLNRINEQKGLNDDKLQFENEQNGVFKRKAGFTNAQALADHKPVEEGAVRVELDSQKKIQLIEPTEPGEKSNSPFVAVDSSFAYIYFKTQKKKDRQILNDEQSEAEDDINARTNFVENLRKSMNLPKGSFSDLKLESTEMKKALTDCSSFSFTKYFIIFNNEEHNCNCKLLIASFKVNPNGLQLNASLVADQVGMYF